MNKTIDISEEENAITITHHLPGEIHSIDVEFGFYLGDEEDEQWKSTQENLNSLN